MIYIYDKWFNTKNNGSDLITFIVIEVFVFSIFTFEYYFRNKNRKYYTVIILILIVILYFIGLKIYYEYYYISPEIKNIFAALIAFGEYVESILAFLLGVALLFFALFKFIFIKYGKKLFLFAEYILNKTYKLIILINIILLSLLIISLFLITFYG